MKKTGKIVLFSFLAVLLLLIVVFFIVYSASPFPTALRFQKAVEDDDKDAFYTCILPDDRVSVRRIQMVTGASLSRLVQYATNTTEHDPKERVFYRLTGYRRRGESAVLSLRASTETSGEWDAELTMVRQGGKWYVALRSPENAD